MSDGKLRSMGCPRRAPGILPVKGMLRAAISCEAVVISSGVPNQPMSTNQMTIHRI